MSKTIVEAKHAVLTYFTFENLLHPEKHAPLVKFDCDDSHIKCGIIRSVLEELSKVDIVRQFEVETGDKKEVWWALTKPLGLYDKTVVISFETAMALADALNGYFKAAGNNKEYTDSTSITEHDIQKLILITESATPKREKSS